MDKKEMLEQLNKLIEDIERLKKTGNPKSLDFVKWIKDVKQNIEQSCGPDCIWLKDFKKINYYPSKLVLFGGDVAVKDAYIGGLSAAKDILLSVKQNLENTDAEESASPEPVLAVEPVEVDEKPIADSASESDKVSVPQEKPVAAIEEIIDKLPESKEKEGDEDFSEYPEFNGDSFKQNEEVSILNKKIAEEVGETAAPSEKKSAKREEKAEIEQNDEKDEYQVIDLEPVKKAPHTLKKVLLLSERGEPLTSALEKFINSVGFELKALYTDREENLFTSNVLKEAAVGNTAYSIVFWKAESQADGKNIPSLQILLATAYLTAKLSHRKVLVLHWPDIDPEDPNFAGFNLVEIEKIPELMDLKIAREMDAAGLNVDFNVFKKI
ncbi:MAG: hypothetical protein LBU09_04350 [Endomicrobium sp.]|jgi:hypothetical protein|nr:hypothetical protein [Endomicrobium sp.]